MNDHIRDVTHNNVLRLLSAIENERKLRVELQQRFEALEKHVKSMSADLAEAKSKSNAAMAIARNINGSSTAG